MTARGDARALLYRGIASALKERGFTKVRGTQRFVRAVAPGVEAQIGVASSTKGSADHYLVDPSVGVLVEEARDLLARWTRAEPAWTTLYLNIGYLPPEQGWSEVPLATVDDVPGALSTLLRDVDERAQGFIDSCHRPGYLADLIEAGVPALRSEELVAVLRALDGDVAGARRGLEALQAKVEASVSPSLRDLRVLEGCADHVRHLLDEASS